MYIKNTPYKSTFPFDKWSQALTTSTPSFLTASLIIDDLSNKFSAESWALILTTSFISVDPDCAIAGLI